MAGLLELIRAAALRETTIAVLLVVIVALFAATIAFSAYAIVLRTRHARRSARREQLGERWRAPMLETLIEPSTLPSVHALVEPGQQLHFVGFALEHARRVRGHERAIFQRMVEPYLSRVVARVTHRSVEVRARAVQTLGMLGLPRYEALVTAALDDPSELVSMVAARALSRAETPQYAQLVIARIHRFHLWSRRFLASMLAAIGPEASPLLRLGLADAGSEAWVRAVLTDALRQQRDFLSGDVAAQVLGTTDDRELLAATLRLLRQVGRPEHRPRVRGLCASQDEVVRAQALWTLGVVGGEEDVPLLRDAMQDASPWTALCAARGVREAGGRRVLSGLATSEGGLGELARQVLAEEAA